MACQARIAVFAGVLLGVLASRPAAGAALTVEDFAVRLAAQRASVRNMFVRGKYSIQGDADAQKAGALEGKFVEHQFAAAFSGNKRYTEINATRLSRGRLLPAGWLATWDEPECRIRERRQLTIQREKSTYSDLNVYLELVGWALPRPAGTAAEPKRERPGYTYVPECLRLGQWTVRATQEFVRGTPCTVLERSDGEQRLWLDFGRGLAVVRSFRATLPQEKNQVIDYEDFVEVTSGYFLPRRIRVEVEALDRSGKRQGKTQSQLEATEISVNNVSDRLFSIAPTAGDFVRDNIRKASYIFVPHGERTLDQAADRIRWQLMARASRDSPLRHLIAIVTLLVVNLVLLLALLRFARRLRAA